MKRILPFLILFISCSKSNDKPQALAQPKWIVINNYYVSQTYVTAVTLNGKTIFGLIGPNEVKVDSTDNPVGTLVMTVSGGGGGDYISYPGGTKTVPQSSSPQTFTFQINGYSAFTIQK